ncbi:hypothetical protein ALNOE001_13080 [Candidatus Methanobinarius endosymbioticus]|uniref:Uncharacterized protein n=1 Tax=Candidatus Methanobinarius endosymbioticus TaxID=2006182 RepID=A0A366MBL9_9EURY|nr:hypothetical protein ALNOE001_13080 [Candidatus Methanobinarius endosymbioticus]
MIKRSQSHIEIHNKIIYRTETTTGWSILIMPDGILLDNYHHGYIHIHPNPNKHNIKEKIKDNNRDKIYMVVCNHINHHMDLALKTLIMELKKMIISLIKEQKGSELVQEMEKTYGSLEEAKKLFKRTPRNMIVVDIENWKYYRKHPNEYIKKLPVLSQNI